MPTTTKTVTARERLVRLEAQGIQRLGTTTNQITPAGIDAIQKLLAENNLPKLPTNWQWVWEGEDGPNECQGTLPKRLRAYMARTYNHKLSDDLLQTIGTLAHSFTEDTNIYYVDVTSKINWRSGEFGDEGSCFWGGRSAARNILTFQGAFAIRLYRPTTNDNLYSLVTEMNHIIDQWTRCPCPVHQDAVAAARREIDAWLRPAEGSLPNLRGRGRAWVVPDAPEVGQVLLFNAYPKNLKLEVFARVMAMLLDETEYHSISLQNRGSTGGIIYINSGAGVVVGPHHRSQHSYDLNWSEYVPHVCTMCNREAPHVHQVNLLAEPPGAANAQAFAAEICEDCLSRLERCVVCGVWYPRGNGKLAKRLNSAVLEGLQTVCPACITRAVPCLSCGMLTINDGAGEKTRLTTGRLTCGQCYHKGEFPDG